MGNLFPLHKEVILQYCTDTQCYVSSTKSYLYYLVEHLSAAKYAKYYSCLAKTDSVSPLDKKVSLMEFPLLFWHNVKLPIAMGLL